MSALPVTLEAVLGFWFEALPGEPGYGRQRAIWFEKDDAFDAAVRVTLGPAHEQAAAGMLDGWAAAPRGALGLAILLDQVPRNVFRGSPRAYATDAHARAVAETAIAEGHDRALMPVERLFLYLPLEHSESIVDQRRALSLFAALDPLPETKGVLATVQRHHDIVARFGRFPHRNAALGRVSTAAELAFLAGPDSSF